MPAELKLMELIQMWILVYICAAVPFVGMHGAIVLAAALRADWEAAFLLSTAGAVTTLVLLMRIDRETIERLRKWRVFDAFFDTIDRYIERHRDGIDHHAYRTLAAIVAVPFTGIGVLAACVLAKLLDLEPRRAAAALSAGTAVNSFLTTAAVYGLLTGLRTILGVFL